MAEMDEPNEAGLLLLSLIADMKALNLRLAALREVLSEHLGISDAQYDAALAKVTASVDALQLDAPPPRQH